MCICIHGYIQPGPFVQRHYPQLTEIDDGFVDRFAICSPKVRLLLDEEVEEWSTKLRDENLKTLEEPYCVISKWHQSGQTYTYSTEANEQYRLFANEMAKLLNATLDANALAHTHVSKASALWSGKMYIATCFITGHGDV